MLKRFIADDRGLETVEYAIITGMIVTGLIAVVVAIGTWIKGKFDALKTNTGA
jgi:Flp pilus assembly pilin Flp